MIWSYRFKWNQVCFMLISLCKINKKANVCNNKKYIITNMKSSFSRMIYALLKLLMMLIIRLSIKL